jgi:uncharacterized protein
LKPRFVYLANAATPVRLSVFIALLALVWLPPYGLIRVLVSNANTVSILATSLLVVEFTALLWFWTRRVYRSARPLQRYGLEISRANGLDLLRGLVVGFLSLLTLFAVESLSGWLTWQSSSLPLYRLVLEGLLVALGVGLGEELIFRGWLLSELEQDYHPTLSLWLDSLVYAGLHYTKPIQEGLSILFGASLSFQETLRTLPQFPGLVLLGMLLVWAKRSTPSTSSVQSPSNRSPSNTATSTPILQQNRLGLSIGLHAGLVWGYYIVNVGEIVHYTGEVSPWVTGVDHNPLAGGMGMLFLAAIAIWVKWRSS